LIVLYQIADDKMNYSNRLITQPSRLTPLNNITPRIVPRILKIKSVIALIAGEKVALKELYNKAHGQANENRNQDNAA